MKTLGLIPARGGSKGIKNKNIQTINGKPLIAYTIEQALNSNIDRVIVASDDEKIIQVAKKYGAECPFVRPKQISLVQCSNNLSDTRFCIASENNGCNAGSGRPVFYPDWQLMNSSGVLEDGGYVT